MRPFHLFSLALLCATVAFIVPDAVTATVALVAGQGTTAPGVADVNVFATAAVGFVASLALGSTKTSLERFAVKVGGLDRKITNAIKPAQPLILLGLAWALPKAAAFIGVIPPETADFVNAPLATIIGISAREGMRRVFGMPPTPATTYGPGR